MKKRKLKSFVVPSVYVLTICVFATSMYLIQGLFNNEKFDNQEMIYVDNEIVTDNIYIPVVNTVPTIMRPYLNESVYVSKSFYNYQGETENQENAIIFYEGTYMQNSGIDYKLANEFEVIAILDGTVIEVTENEILGKTIKVQHENDLISVYQCLSRVDINVNDIVLRGQVIGMSGTSTLYSNESNLHFELYHHGSIVNPDDYYNRAIDEL